MRRKYGGYILLFTHSDHDGRHIHIFRDNRQLGVYDRMMAQFVGWSAIGIAS